MKSVREWVFSQLLASSRPLSGNGSFFHGGSRDNEFDDQGISSSILLFCVHLYVDHFKLNICEGTDTFLLIYLYEGK